MTFKSTPLVGPTKQTIEALKQLEITKKRKLLIIISMPSSNLENIKDDKLNVLPTVTDQAGYEKLLNSITAWFTWNQNRTKRFY